MRFLKILFTFLLLCNLHCAFAKKSAPRIKKLRKGPKINNNIIKGHTDYSFNSCLKYKDDKNNYILTCRDKKMITEEKIFNLDSDTQQIQRHIYGQFMLEELKNFTLDHLKSKQTEISNIRACLKNLQKDSCALLISDLFENTKTDLTKMRYFLALKDRALPQNGLSIPDTTQPFRKLINHSIKPFYSEPPASLSDYEQSEIRKIYNEEYNFLKQKWMAKNLELFPGCIGKETKNNRYYIYSNKNCDSIKSKVSISASREFNQKTRKDYSQEYLNLIQTNPLLFHINIPSDAKDEELFSSFVASLEKLGDSIDSSIDKISKAKGHKLKSLINYDVIANNFIKKNGSKKYICDVMQSYKDQKDRELLGQDIAIGLGVVGAGIFCGLSGGLICSFATALGGEALTMSVMNNRYQEANGNFQSGLIKSDNLESMANDFDIASVLAPTAILGLNGGIKLTKGTIKNLKNNKVSIVSQEKARDLFKQLKNQEHIPFCYAKDGCQARAHEMARLLEEQGIITEKAFIQGKLIADTSFDGSVEWDFHVAPLIKVRESGKTKLYILDPSLFDEPVPLEQWQDYMLKAEGSFQTYAYRRSRFHYTPKDKNENLDTYKEKDIRNMKKRLNLYYQRYLRR